MSIATQPDIIPPQVVFSLDDAIRDILANTDLSSPDAITLELMHRLPSRNQAAALAQSLPTYVRQRIAAERALTSPQGARQALIRSAKVGGITELWRKILDDRVNTPAGWKTLGECTRDDLAHAERVLKSSAAKFLSKAQRYGDLRAQLEMHAVDRVRDLEKNVLVETFGTLPDGRTGIDDPDDDTD